MLLAAACGDDASSVDAGSGDAGDAGPSDGGPSAFAVAPPMAPVPPADLRIADTTSAESEGRFGRGLDIGESSHLVARRLLVERNQESVAARRSPT